MYPTEQTELLRKAVNERFPELAEISQRTTIKRLDLTLNREYAQQIVDGTKTVEFRFDSEFWIKRFCNKKVVNFFEHHEKEFWKVIRKYYRYYDIERYGIERIFKYLPFKKYFTPNNLFYAIPLVKRVETIHFHNYDPNGWRLTIECPYNNYYVADNYGKEWLHHFNSYEQDEEFELWEGKKTPLERRDNAFFFVVGEIISVRGLEKTPPTSQ